MYQVPNNVAYALTNFFILLLKNSKVEKKYSELNRVVNMVQKCATFEQKRTILMELFMGTRLFSSDPV